jgi:oligopeptide transport system ATP-binding protein
MYLGHLVEFAETEELFKNPCHPYTRALLNAVPVLDPDRTRNRRKSAIEPEAQRLPDQCLFQPRCPEAVPECVSAEPPVVECAPGHWVKCVHARTSI